EIADEPHADSVRVELLDLAVERVDEQRHQTSYLVVRTPPVLAREREQRKSRHAALRAELHRRAHGLEARRMPGLARQRAPARPTSVAVHDDGDVTRGGGFGFAGSRVCDHRWAWRGGGLPRGVLGLAGGGQISMISASFSLRSTSTWAMYLSVCF